MPHFPLARTALLQTIPPSLLAMPLSARAAYRRAGPVATLAAAVLLTSAIVLARLADGNDADAVLLLLVIPIALVTAQLGPAGGLAAATVSLALVGVWDNTYDVGLGALGYVTRAVVFLTGAFAGLMLSKLPDLDQPRIGGPPAARPRFLTAPPLTDVLSAREREVLEMIASGATNARIAERFVISQDTVKTHVKHIFQKLDVANRTEAALHYVELYGRPPSAEEPRSTTGSRPAKGAEPGGTPQLDATHARRGTVVLGKSDRVAVRLDDGRAIELPSLEAIRDRLAPGAEMIVYFDRMGNPLGWYLPGADLGLDLRD
jgi:DNA-binding CsgD family transcriptional regulator